MIVVSDTSPITALLAIGREGLLQTLFGEVVIPSAVHRELLTCHAILPDWLRVMEVRDTDHVQRILGLLDVGEAEAIALATELRADLLLIDERKGRREAMAEGIHVIGLLGVVLLGKRRGLVESAAATLDSLRRQAGVYLAENIIRTALDSVGE